MTYDIFTQLGFTPEEGPILAVLGLAWLVVLLFRAFTALVYRDQMHGVRTHIKDGVKEKADIEKIEHGFFRRAAVDYKDLGERGAAVISSRELCVKSSGYIKLLFWSLGSVERFLNAMEPVLLAAGIFAALLSESRLSFAFVTFVFFVVEKFITSMTDPVAAKEELISRTAFLLDREIGKFYITDTTAAVHMMRRDIQDSITYQSQYLSNAIDELRDKLTAASEKTLGDTARAIESTLNSVSATAETVQKPLDAWKEALLGSSKAQEELNLATEKMSRTLDSFKENSDAVDKLIEGYKAEFMDNNKNVERALSRLEELTAKSVKTVENTASQSEAVSEAIEYVRRNQSALQNSMNQYETALKEITSQVGEGLGKILGYHTENSARAMADGVSESLLRVNAANNELFSKLQSVLEGILEQGRKETTMILNLKEQMEIEIEQAKDKTAE